MRNLKDLPLADFLLKKVKKKFEEFMSKSVEYYLSQGFDRLVAEYFATGRKNLLQSLHKRIFHFCSHTKIVNDIDEYLKVRNANI